MTLISRRAFTLGSVSVGIIAPGLALLSPCSGAAAAVPLDPSDPTAKALGFVADPKKVDAAANPTFKPTQTCSSCAQYQGKPTQMEAACNIFAGKTVPAGGWCKVWAARSGG